MYALSPVHIMLARVFDICSHWYLEHSVHGFRTLSMSLAKEPHLQKISEQEELKNHAVAPLPTAPWAGVTSGRSGFFVLSAFCQTQCLGSSSEFWKSEAPQGVGECAFHREMGL